MPPKKRLKRRERRGGRKYMATSTQVLPNLYTKCGKYVPVIIQQELWKLMQYLTNVEVRKTAGISSNNPYVFASNRAGVIRGYDAIIYATQAADLEKPERIRSSNMRRYMATMSQAFNVTPKQQQWIIDHMGHTLDVHNIHYRATSDAIERSEIAKHLLVMDFGKVGQFKGKQLQEIQMDDFLIDEGSSSSEVEEPSASMEAENCAVMNVEDRAQSLPFEDDYIPDFTEGDEVPLAKPRAARKPTGGNLHSWTPDEIREVFQLFKKWFQAERTPGQAALKSGIKKSKALNGNIWKIPQVLWCHFLFILVILTGSLFCFVRQ